MYIVRPYGQLDGPLLDPFSDLEATGARGPGVTVITDSPWTPPAVIPPGIYIVQHGLRMTGGISVGSGVMLYITGGSLDLSSHAELQLSPPITHPYYGKTNLVIWQDKADTAPMSFQASTGTFYTLFAPDGGVYTPTAAVALVLATVGSSSRA